MYYPRGASQTRRRGAGPRFDLWQGVRWGLALLLAGVTAWLSIRQVRWTMLKSALLEADWPMLTWALGTVLATTLAKAARWHVLLQTCDASIGGLRVLRVLLIGQLGNSFLPARLGDVGRAVLAGSRVSGGIPAVLGTILAEKALDGVMGLLILIGLALWMPLPYWLHGPILGLGLLTGILFVLLTLAATKGGWAVHPVQGLIGWLPGRMQARIRNLLVGFRLGLGLFRQPAHALLALALSAVVWGLAALTNVLVLDALGIEAPDWSIWLVLVTGYAANFVPTVPAQVGVFEYTHMLALTAAGVGQEPALAFSLILHLLVYAPPAILGSVSMAVEGLGWAKLEEARQEYREHKDAPL
jgi:uncharacterized protein (TIRG00374 family)